MTTGFKDANGNDLDQIYYTTEGASGVTAGSSGPTANVSYSKSIYRDTAVKNVTIPNIQVNSKGQVTARGQATVYFKMAS